MRKVRDKIRKKVARNSHASDVLALHGCVLLKSGPPVPEFVRSRSQSVVSGEFPGTAQRISDQSRLQR